MTSLQVRHQRGCALGRPWTPLDRMDGCNCTPTYNVVSRLDGKLIRQPVGHDLERAGRELAKVQDQLEEGAYRAPVHMTFAKWADTWLDGLRRQPTTIRVYGITMAYAKATFGRKQLRKLTPADVRGFLAHIEREHRKRQESRRPKRPVRDVSPTTLAKHLRQLAACLEAARAEGLIIDNPVRRLHKTAKPRPVKKRPSYFTDAELARLWPELAKRSTEQALCRLAVTTGLRFGELAALRWPDVRLLEGELIVHVAKSGEPRTVDLVPAARDVLAEWYASTGDDGLVFESITGRRLDGANVLKVLYAAMTRAGIARESERGGKRTFHSFRNTFARIALEAGAELTWVQAQLGHSSIVLTRDVYGAWSRSAEKAQAEKLAGAFTI